MGGGAQGGFVDSCLPYSPNVENATTAAAEGKTPYVVALTPDMLQNFALWCLLIMQMHQPCNLLSVTAPSQPAQICLSLPTL